MADDVAINFARMSQLVQVLGDADTNISSILDRLDNNVSRLDKEWSGDASAAYHGAHKEWAASLAAMNGILARAKSTTSSINERHRAAESKVQALWS